MSQGDHIETAYDRATKTLTVRERKHVRRWQLQQPAFANDGNLSGLSEAKCDWAEECVPVNLDTACVQPVPPHIVLPSQVPYAFRVKFPVLLGEVDDDCERFEYKYWHGQNLQRDQPLPKIMSTFDSKCSESNEVEIPACLTPYETWQEQTDGLDLFLNRLTPSNQCMVLFKLKGANVTAVFFPGTGSWSTDTVNLFNGWAAARQGLMIHLQVKMIVKCHLTVNFFEETTPTYYMTTEDTDNPYMMPVVSPEKKFSVHVCTQ